MDPCVILKVFEGETTFTPDNVAGLSKKTVGVLIETGVTSTLCLLLVPAGSPLRVFDE